MTLAWPGWKQSDIAVEVDTGQKRFIYRLLARHDSLPVWLVADK